MIHTFHIDKTSAKAKALIDYMRTLDFIHEEKSDSFELSEEQIQIIEESRRNYISGKDKGSTWDEVLGRLKDR